MQLGCEIAVMIGGGNILRGSQFKARSSAIQEATAHYMGMLGTVINGLALQDALEVAGLPDSSHDGHPHGRRRRTLHSPPRSPPPGKRPDRAAGRRHRGPVRHDRHGRGPRALELDAGAVLKATRVDGVYSDDPEKNPHAVLYGDLTYGTVLKQNLRVMDHTAIAHCMEHRMPILVFNYKVHGNIQRAVRGDKLGTLIHGELPRRRGTVGGECHGYVR